MTDATLSTELQYYAAIGAALFPIPAGSKDPVGIVASFKHDWSRDPVQWSAWRASYPGCNFGIVGFASNLIIVDIDTKGDDGRAEAWALWTEVCRSWGLPGPLAPHCQSPSGGWHVYCRVPADVDAATLRQPDAIKKRINIRCIGYTVTADSFYDGTAKGETSGPYILIPNTSAPHPAPAALVQHCTRRARPSPSAAKAGTYDFADVVALFQWMAEHGGFDAYEDWLQAGMVSKIEFGDAGLALWEITHDGTVTPDIEQSKWDSFADAATGDSQTLGSLLKRAHDMGWRGTVRKSTAAMFGDVAGTVAQLAANAGATLSSQQPIPLADTQRIVAALGQPVLDNFLEGTRDAPFRGNGATIALPETLKDHPLYDLLNDAVQRILAMAEGGSKTFRQERVLEVIGLLIAVHQETSDNLCQRLRAMGCVLSPGRPEEAGFRFDCRVMAEIRTAAGFTTNNKGEPDPKNSDNVHVFLRLRKVKFRFNVLTDRVEVSDTDRDAYQPLTDAIFDTLLVDAENGQYNFHPSKEGFRRGIDAAARRVPPFDPLREKVDALGSKWDGVSRLDSWLSYTVGAPNDAYHIAVGRNLIGGMVRRARYPGCSHAEAVIFISPDQGTGKSKLCQTLALDDNWFTDSFKLGGTQQNSLPQLAAKWIVELGELAGMAKTEVEDVKQFMTVNVDEYVKKYQSYPTKQPRRCIFIGTSNDKRPLQDETGNRRFLPVHVQGEVNLEWIRANVEQIIGEAAVREAAGESFAIPREVWSAAARHQEDARSMTPVEELCYEWFDRAPGSYYVTASDINRALKMAGQKGRYAKFLDKLGWRDANMMIPNDGRKCRVWLRHSNQCLEDCIRLIPIQAQINGAVEMRFDPRSVRAC